MVDLPLWKIWVSQLGWLFPIYGKTCSKPPTRYSMYLVLSIPIFGGAIIPIPKSFEDYSCLRFYRCYPADIIFEGHYFYRLRSILSFFSINHIQIYTYTTGSRWSESMGYSFQTRNNVCLGAGQGIELPKFQKAPRSCPNCINCWVRRKFLS